VEKIQLRYLNILLSTTLPNRSKAYSGILLINRLADEFLIKICLNTGLVIINRRTNITSTNNYCWYRYLGRRGKLFVINGAWI